MHKPPFRQWMASRSAWRDSRSNWKGQRTLIDRINAAHQSIVFIHGIETFHFVIHHPVEESSTLNSHFCFRRMSECDGRTFLVTRAKERRRPHPKSTFLTCVNSTKRKNPHMVVINQLFSLVCLQSSLISFVKDFIDCLQQQNCQVVCTVPWI